MKPFSKDYCFFFFIALDFFLSLELDVKFALFKIYCRLLFCKLFYNFKSAAIFGTAQYGADILNVCRKLDYHVFFFIDSSIMMQGKEINGITVKHVSYVKSAACRRMPDVIICASHCRTNEMKKILINDFKGLII